MINSIDEDSLSDQGCKKLVSDEQLIIKWSPARLKMELDRMLWKNQPHMGIRKLIFGSGRNFRQRLANAPGQAGSSPKADR